MSTIRCDGCGEYREWDGYTLVKGCSCLGKIGEPTVYDELNELKSDLRKLREELRELSNKKNIRSPWTTERLKGIAKGQSDCADKIDKLLEGKGE